MSRQRLTRWGLALDPGGGPILSGWLGSVLPPRNGAARSASGDSGGEGPAPAARGRESESPNPERRPIRWVFGAALALLVAGGVWLRVTSLGTAPDPNGDEAYFGVQAARLVQGGRAAGQTASGNPLNPYLVAMEIPLVGTLSPSFTLLRIPAAVCGLLGVVLAYVLGARIFDRTTAAIAAVLLLVLPIAIIHSRIGAEPAEVPLCGVVCLYFAFRANRLGLLLAFVASFFAYHTTFMLAPVLMVVILTQLIRRYWDDPVRRWRTPLVTALAGAVVVGPIAALKQGSSAAKWTYQTYGFGHCDWGEFLTLFKKTLLGFCNGVPTETSARHGLIFWGVVLAVLIPGLWCLIRARAWDRLALVASLLLSFAGYHLVLGPGGFHPALSRYSLFLVTPLVFAFACLARAMLVAPITPRLAWIYRGQVAALLVLGFVVLIGYKTNHFDVWVLQSHGRERVWTLKTEAIEPKRRIMRVITADLRGPGARPVATLGGDSPKRWPIVTEDWWHYRPLQFLLVWRKDLDVGCIEHVGAPAQRERIVRDQLLNGGYAVGGEVMDRLVHSVYPPEALRCWQVKAGWHPVSFVYRLRREGEPLMDVVRLVDDQILR